MHSLEDVFFWHGPATTNVQVPQLDSLYIIIIIVVVRVFCPSVSPSQQEQEPRLSYSEGRSSTAKSGSKAVVLLGIE